jgi:hypothetical protein
MSVVLWALVVSVLAGLAGTGVAVLVAASPIPRWIPTKPFICRTCLSGWGSIWVSLGLLVVEGNAPEWAVPEASIASWGPWILWLALSLAGTGLAHVLMGIVDRPGAPLPLPLPEGDQEEDRGTAPGG